MNIIETFKEHNTLQSLNKIWDKVLEDLINLVGTTTKIKIEIENFTFVLNLKKFFVGYFIDNQNNTIKDYKPYIHNLLIKMNNKPIYGSGSVPLNKKENEYSLEELREEIKNNR